MIATYRKDQTEYGETECTNDTHEWTNGWH